ncbi:S1C family serine protease [Bacillaceae bacterium W0354]
MLYKKYMFPLILTVIIFVGSILGVYYYYQSWQEEALGEHTGLVEIVEDEPKTSSKDLKTIIHEAQKFVVQIEAVGSFGENIGSGFIYNNRGDIITNAHVVRNADDIFVKTSEAHTYPGSLIGISKSLDIALIRVPQLSNRAPASIDIDFEPNIGDEIIVVGSPHGFQNTFTDGIISGKNRSFEVGNYEYNNLYQVSANISKGNSGGPLIHKDTGNIIGINSAATTEGTMGFSIPISHVFDLLHMWSDKADGTELSFDGDPNIYDSYDSESLKEDAYYLINYYYDTLNVRDYFTAYSLLGSEEQIKRSYEDFRQLSVRSVKIEVTNIEMEVNEKDYRVIVTVFADHHIRKDEQTMTIYHYKTDYEIGLENDILKILSINQEELSKTEHTVKQDKKDNEDKE